MGSFAEERKKLIEERKKKEQKAGSDKTSGMVLDEPKSFAEERIHTINVRNKSKAKMTQDAKVYNTRMFSVEDRIKTDLGQIAKERADRILAGEKKAKELKERITSQEYHYPVSVQEPVKSSKDYLWGTDAWKEAKERETAATYAEALKRFQTDPQAKAIAGKGQELRHGLPQEAFLGDEADYLLHTSQTYYMTQEERDVYNYLLASEGEKSAKGYLKYLDPKLNERAAGAWEEAGKKIGEEMPVRGALFNTFAGSVAAPTGYLYALAQNLADQKVDHNDPRLAGSRMEDALREGIKENKLPLVGEKTSDFLIDTGLSMAQNVARLPLGHAGLALAAGGAATGGYLDAIDRGGSESQALALGGAQGAAEALFEKFSLEGVEALKAMPPKSGREFLVNLLKQGAVEGSEEAATELANSLSDVVVMRELNNISQDYKNRIANGESSASAVKGTAVSLAGRIGLAAAGGALSGGIMGGGAQALGTYLQGRNSDITDYRELADAIDTESTSSPEQAQAGEELKQIAMELAEKQQNGEYIGAFEKGTLENAVDAYMEMSAENERKEQTAESTPEITEPAQIPLQMDEMEKSMETIKNAQNQRVEVQDMLSDEDQKGQLRAWAEPFGKNGQEAFEDAYDGERELSAYSRGFANYYNAGRYGMELSEANKRLASVYLEPEQASAAYKAGIHDREMTDPQYDRKSRRFVNMVQRDQKTGGLVKADENATESQKKVAAAIGKRTGLKFELVSDTGNDTAVGSYEKGVIRISPNAENFNATMSHELTHFIQDYSPDMYRLYQDQAVKAITKAEGTDLETMIARKIAIYEQAGRSLNREQAVDEIVANATEKFFNDPEYIDEIIKTNRTLGERFLDFIEDVIDAIKSLMHLDGSRTKEAQALEQNLEMYERARTYWMTGLEEAGDRYQSGWEIQTDDTIYRNVPTATNAQGLFKTSETLSGIVPDSILEDSDRKNNIRFQIKEPVEETKNLIAVHNLTEDKLLKTFQYEGIPMPSIAITKADIGHENFGDISLLFTKDTIDPKKKKNKVYGADAWTPTFPKIEYETDLNVSRNIVSKVRNWSQNIPESYRNSAISEVSGLEYTIDNYGGKAGLIEKAMSSTALKATFLASKGHVIEQKVKEEKVEISDNEKAIYQAILDRIGHIDYENQKGSGRSVYNAYGTETEAGYVDGLVKTGVNRSDAEDYVKRMRAMQVVDAFRKAYNYQENGGVKVAVSVDYETMRKDIAEQLDQNEYRKWLEELFDGIEKDSGVYNGKDIFTPSGNRRSFKQTHMKVTAENIVKAMLAQSEDVRNVSGFNGIKSIRAVATEDFKSIKQIKEASAKLKDIDSQEYEAQNEELSQRMYRVMEDVLDQSGRVNNNRFIDMDTIGYILLDACNEPTVDNICSVFNQHKWKITGDQAKEFAEIIQEVQNMPVNMFEAKPQRVVGYDEIAAAVVPDNASEAVLETLKERGVKILTYDSEDKRSRINVVNSVNGIRFQLEDTEDHENDITRLLKENQELKEANALLKKQFELTSKEELRQSDIQKISRKVLKNYGSSMNAEVLDRNLTRLYEYIRSGENMDMDEVSAAAADIARSVLNKSQNKDTELMKQYKDLRKQLRETKIMITDQDKKDLASMGGYNEFRKKYFGRLKLGNGGISVDTLYQELTDQHPELFQADVTHPADQLMQIGNVLDLTQEQLKNPYHANMDEMAYIVGQELLSEYANVRLTEPTFADRKKAELERVRKEYQDKEKAYREKLHEQYNAAVAKMKSEGDYNIRWRDAELYAQRDKFNQNINKQRYKKGIIREVNKLGKWLMEPNDEHHIPQELRGVVAEFLNSIDFSSKRDVNGVATERTRAWIEASASFTAIINNSSVMKDENGNEVYIDVDPDMAERIKEIRKKVDGTDKLDNLDAYNMEELYKIVISMKKALTEINAMKSNAKYAQISLLSEDVFRYTEDLKDKHELAGWLGKGESLVNYDMLDPQTMFEKMGSAMKSTYDALRIGLDVKTIRLKEAADYFDQALKEAGISTAEIRKWTGVNAQTQVFELSQGKIELSIPQIMSLYELDKRGQAKKHIYDRSGGIKADDLKKGISWDNRSIKMPQTKKSYRPVKVTEADVKKITSTLTNEQKMLADAMQRFMGHQIADWGNEVSMEMYGYKKFTARNYFPIVTDKNYIMQAEGSKQNSAIKNLGITKGTNRFANNPVIIEDVFEVFTRQVDQMSSYNAYVIPLSDLHKVMNYKDMRGFNGSSIKEELERTFGKGGVKYINKLIDDINGSIKTDPDIGSALLSNMKAASVAGNLRVAVQQPTSIARAAAEIDVRYLAKGIAKANRDWDTITKYAPVAQWKDWGFYKMQTDRQMKDVLIGSDSAKQRFVNRTMFLAAAGDKLAWKHICGAVEAEVSEKYPELEYESEAFFEKVGQRFSEIIDKTQVADSVLHRTQIMRSNNGAVKMATSFMAEPLKSYNMMYRAFWAARTGKKDETKRLAKTVSAYIASAFLNAASAAFVDALRDDDRKKEYQEKYKENFIGNVKDNVNVLNSIPYVKDIISTFQGYTPKRTDIQGFQDMYYATRKIDKMISGESSYTPQYVFLEAAKSMSAITGIPIKSLVRDAIAIIDTAVNAEGGESDYTWLKQTYDIGFSGNQKMYIEMMLQAENSGNKELAKRIYSDLIENGMTEEDFDKKVNTIVNDMLDNEGVDVKEAALGYDSKKPDSRKAFVQTVDRYIELKSISGWDKKKCMQQIRSILTGIYKPQYKTAKTQKEKDAIIQKCKSYYYDGDSIYKDYRFATEWK